MKRPFNLLMERQLNQINDFRDIRAFRVEEGGQSERYLMCPTHLCSLSSPSLPLTRLAITDGLFRFRAVVTLNGNAVGCKC